MFLPLDHIVHRDGAINRSKLEKTDPTISYELFVEELDAGDSFTTSLIDILVKVRLDLYLVDLGAYFILGDGRTSYPPYLC